MTRIIFTIFLFCSSSSIAYVISKTDRGDNTKWAMENKYISLAVKINNSGSKTSSLNSSEITAMVNESVAEWNGISKYQIVPKYESNEDISSYNNVLSFSDNPAIFSSGVLAVTSINFTEAHGNILEANIYVNDSFSNLITFSENKSDTGAYTTYFGDVLTHELGHFLGLSHSETIGASMIYSIFKNQHTIHPDDQHGVEENYNIKRTLGELKGRVVGGSGIPLFGINVNLFSTKTGNVISSQLTNDIGRFHFKNLDESDTYYIQTLPVKKVDSLPNYYKNIKNDFCNKDNFQASFYTTCGGRGKSRPQQLSPSLLKDNDVGDISIRCDQRLNPDYLENKFSSAADAVELITHEEKGGFLFNGYFFDTEIDLGEGAKGDYFTIDLRGFDYTNLNYATTKLHLNLLASKVGSVVEPVLYIKRSDSISWTKIIAENGDNLKKELNLAASVSLSSVASENIFELKVFGVEVSNTDKIETFAIASVLGNTESSYIIQGVVGDKVSNTIEPFNSDDISSYPYSDNSLCREGSSASTVNPYKLYDSSSSSNGSSNESEVGITCGTIDIDSDSNNSGLGSFVIGLLLCGMLSFKEKLRIIILSKQ